MMPGNAERKKLTWNVSQSFCYKARSEGGVVNPLPGGVLVLYSCVNRRRPGVAEVKLKVV